MYQALLWYRGAKIRVMVEEVPQATGDTDSGTAIYFGGALITGIIAFAIAWVWSASWFGGGIAGVLGAVLIGWLPALIIGVVVGLLWPLLILGLIWLFNQ